MALTIEEVATIKATIPVLQAHGNAITSTFYNNLLADTPQLNDVFSSTDQKTGSQPRALAGALFAYASNIDNLGALSPAVERICQKHASLSVAPEHYDIVGKYLLAAMGEVLGSALTPDILAAWGAAYVQLANIMIGREADLYKSFEEWTSWRKFKIAKKVEESENITSFYLSPEDGKVLPTFKPGQYISVRLRIHGLDYLQARQYSLSDAPRPDFYRISVKKEPGVSINGNDAEVDKGLVSNELHDHREVGDVIEVSHPAGEFFLDSSEAEKSPVVLLSAGVGFTPMLSILNSLVETKTSQKISWIYSARSSAVHAFRQHIRDISKANENFHTVIFKSNIVANDIEGEDYHHAVRMDLSKVSPDEDLYLSTKGTTYYVCGPTSFMSQTAAYLKGVGVPVDKVKLELFGTGGAE